MGETEDRRLLESTHRLGCGGVPCRRRQAHVAAGSPRYAQRTSSPQHRLVSGQHHSICLPGGTYKGRFTLDELNWTELQLANCSQSTLRVTANASCMVWYGVVNVNLCSAIITKVSNALNTLVSGEKPGFHTLSKGLIVLLCAEVVRQEVPDHGAVHSKCSASNSG